MPCAKAMPTMTLFQDGTMDHGTSTQLASVNCQGWALSHSRIISHVLALTCYCCISQADTEHRHAGRNRSTTDFPKLLPRLVSGTILSVVDTYITRQQLIMQAALHRLRTESAQAYLRFQRSSCIFNQGQKPKLATPCPVSTAQTANEGVATNVW